MDCMKFDQQLSAETLPTKIYRILREAILNGQLKPGERLVQEELAKSFNVSRMPVREAVTQLAADGFVTIEPHKGAIVKEFSVHEIEELYFLRSKFEPLAAAESLHKLTASLLETLETLNEQMKKTKEVDVYIALNIEFHHHLIQHCPWEKLNALIESLWSGFPQQTPHLLPHQIKTSIDEHDLIIGALKDNDIAEACRLLELHIQRVGQNVLQNLKQSNKLDTISD